MQNICHAVELLILYFFDSALTNADFRKLLMTPRAAPSVAPPTLTKIKQIHSSHIHSERFAFLVKIII